MLIETIESLINGVECSDQELKTLLERLDKLKIPYYYCYDCGCVPSNTEDGGEPIFLVETFSEKNAIVSLAVSRKYSKP